MSIATELNPVHFYRILHSLIRADESVKEKDRSTGVMSWPGDNVTGMNRVVTEAQARVLDVIWKHYQQQNYAPSRFVVDQLVAAKNAPQNMEMVLVEYDRFAPTLERAQPMDMPTLLEARKKDWVRVQMSEVLSEALSITNGPVPINPKKPPMHGAQDAVTYIMEKVASGLISGVQAGRSAPTVSGPNMQATLSVRCSIASRTPSRVARTRGSSRLTLQLQRAPARSSVSSALLEGPITVRVRYSCPSCGLWQGQASAYAWFLASARSKMPGLGSPGSMPACSLR